VQVIGVYAVGPWASFPVGYPPHFPRRGPDLRKQWRAAGLQVGVDAGEVWQMAAAVDL